MNINYKVCLIVLNYVSFEDTITYVKEVLRQEGVDLHVLVVDNKSPNESYAELSNEFTDNPRVRTIESKYNGGYAYGNNYGLKYIVDEEFEYIVISNNDLNIENPKLLIKLINKYEVLQSPAFIAPITVNNGVEAKSSAWKMPALRDDLVDSLRVLKVFFKNRIQYDFIDDKTYKVDCLPGSFFLAKKNVFYDIGLFDEKTFLYCEERILAWKAKELGLSNYLVRSFKIEHFVSKTISSQLSMLKMMSYLTDSRVYFHRQYLKSNVLGILLLQALSKLRIVESLLYDIVRGAFVKKDL